MKKVTAWLCVSCLMGVVGCGSSSEHPLVMVSGNVTQNGTPLSGVNVMFIPESGEGAPSGGQTDNSGAFELQYTDGHAGAVVGKHRVIISVPTPEPPAPMGGETRPVAQQTSPEFYKQAEVTDEGENRFAFEVSAN